MEAPERDMQIFSSTIIPTIGRSSLSRAVDSVLEQDMKAGEFEIIVVNDSGQPLAEASWQHSERVRTIDTNRRERSVARNCGAAIAHCRYLNFLDDDDWLLPNALDSFWRLAQKRSDAAWLLGGIQIVDIDGNTWAEINAKLEGNRFGQILGGAWAPIQASLIRSEIFQQVGGYDPLVTGTEDLDLCRRVALIGSFASTTEVVAALLRDVSWGSSTDYEIGPATNRQSRDRVLAQPGAFGRVKTSSLDSFWYGRVQRVYIGSVLLNLRSGKLASALDRSICTLGVAVLAFPRMLSLDFWEALRLEHVPGELFHVLLSMETKKAKEYSIVG